MRTLLPPALLPPALLPLALLLAACSSAPPTTRIASIQIIADSRANDNTATDLDLVFVYDAALPSTLPRTGPDWFVKRAALEAGLATSIEVVHVQLPPGKQWSAKLSARQHKAIAVYSYPNYIPAKGQEMRNLTPFNNMTINLLPDRIDYQGN